jgi:hypothetical protein
MEVIILLCGTIWTASSISWTVCFYLHRLKIQLVEQHSAILLL